MTSSIGVTFEDWQFSKIVPDCYATKHKYFLKVLMVEKNDLSGEFSVFFVSLNVGKTSMFKMLYLYWLFLSETNQLIPQIMTNHQFPHTKKVTSWKKELTVGIVKGCKDLTGCGVILRKYSQYYQPCFVWNISIRQGKMKHKFQNCQFSHHQHTWTWQNNWHFCLKQSSKISPVITVVIMTKQLIISVFKKA